MGAFILGHLLPSNQDMYKGTLEDCVEIFPFRFQSSKCWIESYPTQFYTDINLSAILPMDYLSFLGKIVTSQKA